MPSGGFPTADQWLLIATVYGPIVQQHWCSIDAFYTLTDTGSLFTLTYVRTQKQWHTQVTASTRANRPASPIANDGATEREFTFDVEGPSLIVGCAASSMPMVQNQTHIATIPEELCCQILGLLTPRDILACSLTCRVIYNTVKYSTELQYQIELGRQRLIEVHPPPLTSTWSRCLLKLRDKSAAWGTLSPQMIKYFSVMSKFDHACIYHNTLYLTSDPIPTTNTHPVDPTFHPACIDISQDLGVYHAFHNGETHSFFYLLFESMSSDNVHPLVHNAEEGIIASREEFPCELGKEFISVAVFGDRVAASISLYKFHPFDTITGSPPVFVRSFVEIQNWQEDHGHACTVNGDYALTGIQFLNAERLLVMVGLGYIKVHDIRDLCQVPTRLAMCELPGGDLSIVSLTVPHDSPSCAGHASQTHFIPCFIIISPRAFDAHLTPLFMDSDPVAWEIWGPSNCCSFVLDKHHHLFAVVGMRFAWSAPISNTQGTSIQLHVANFNPSAVARGIGWVINDPVTTSAFGNDAVTTSLPYVEVVSSQVYPLSCISCIMLDEERLLLFTSSEIDLVDLQYCMCIMSDGPV
ncbi:hypothetical protein BDR03DRAFT_983110 [Suillus americanus]|nr:hypothetical protein BDR03DRAFT_983110 [Suillus americanus]